MTTHTTTEWIRRHIEYQLGIAPTLSFEEITKHVRARLDSAFERIRSRVALGFIRYESNRGRSPCYRAWLGQALKTYDETGNTEALFDVAFYAIAESETPSREGTFFNDSKELRDEL